MKHAIFGSSLRRNMRSTLIQHAEAASPRDHDAQREASA